MKQRCHWAENNNILIQQYHDHEWGIPCHDDQKLFEFLSLEIMQSGLSWQTILKKRDNFKLAFSNWNINKIAKYDESTINNLLKNQDIIRNRRKIQAIIHKAQIVLQIQLHQSFNDYIWQYSKFKTIKQSFDIQIDHSLSIKVTTMMKKTGFKFIGPTIIESFLEAIGVINAHEPQCFLN
ncbi:MAG: DNA-3-methyladenine glycosylase I [Firmicutes bacterium]|uniref:DNA-3-methyladenine glycosylase I n=1 Tax=Candidatus Gallilactobacillus intestinavium TaxID=2840838 RepID=A0A9D9HA98_9LACO|nr:DNA-3-methyladenine glycosylase I [Candidatus Gallilactobacillus intestinavium]